MKNKLNKYSMIFAVICMFFCFGCNPIQHRTVLRLHEINEDIISKRLIKSPYPGEYDTLITETRTMEIYKYYEESFRKNKPDVIIDKKEAPITSINSHNIFTNYKKELLLKKPEKLRAEETLYFARLEIENLQKTVYATDAMMSSADKAKNNDRITELSGLITVLDNAISIIDNYVIDSLMQRNPDKEKMDIIKDIVNKGEAMTTSYFNIMIDVKDSIYSLTFPLNFSFRSGEWELPKEAKERINKVINTSLISAKNFEKDYQYNVDMVLYVHAYSDEQGSRGEWCEKLNEFYPDKNFTLEGKEANKEKEYRKYCNQLLSQKRADETKEYIIKYIKEKQAQINVIEREIIGQGENYPYDSINPPYKHNDERRRIVVISLGLSISE